MASIVILSFSGEVPRTTPRLLENSQAVYAVNCELARGHLEALRGPGKVAELAKAARTIFKHRLDGWLAWDKPVNVVENAIPDAADDAPLGQLFITGDRPYPTQYLAGGHVCRLGLPRPKNAPLTEVVRPLQAKTAKCLAWGSYHDAIAPARYGQEEYLNSINFTWKPVKVRAIGWRDDINSAVCNAATTAEIMGWDEEQIIDCGKERACSYCYTYVRALASGVIRQESAPSPATRLLDVPDGHGVRLSGFAPPDLPEHGITHIRIYRTVSGLQSSDFRFVCELPLSCPEYEDTTLDRNISAETLQTATWDMIPDDAQGLIVTDNGIYAAFRGNELLLSEPYHAYAFPTDYRLIVEDRIIALWHWENTIAVLTEGRPYLAVGNEPGQMQLARLPYEQGCIAALSLGHDEARLLYASPDGLVEMAGNNMALATARLFTREQWQKLNPANILGAVIDGKYLGFFANTNCGFILGKDGQGIVRVCLPEDMKVQALYHHSLDDCVYVSMTCKDGSGVWRWEAGKELPYLWRSKPFFTSRILSMRAVRIEGEQTSCKRVNVAIYGPDLRRPRQRLKLADTRSKRIQSMRAEKLWTLELSGTVTVYEARLGTGIEELEYGV